MDINDMLSSFKNDIEKQAFVEQQHKTIIALSKKNQSLEEEVKHLKELLASTTSLVEAPKVEKIIVTPEEALIDKQIEMIQMRGVLSELSLEDTKKLDLLLKNKKLIQDTSSIPVQSKKIDKKNISDAELIQIVLSKKDDKSK